MIAEIDLAFQDVSRDETAVTSHVFAKRSGETNEPYTTYLDSTADLAANRPPVFIRIKQERPKVSAQSFGTRRTTVSLTHNYIIPTPKATDLGGITFKVHASASVGVTENQLSAAIARFRALVAKPEFSSMITVLDQ